MHADLLLGYVSGREFYRKKNNSRIIGHSQGKNCAQGGRKMQPPFLYLRILVLFSYESVDSNSASEPAPPTLLMFPIVTRKM